jgi:NADPH2:quinone reductase
MKAVVVEKYDSIDNIGLKDIALPAVSSGQVRVKIQAASIGFVDGLKVQGLYQTKDPLPFTPGTEFSGIVDEAADDVTGFARGTPVMGMTRSGALAEYITVPAAAVTAMPDGIAPEVGAAFRANYLTGLYALERATLRAGEYLLVLGAAGGVGIAAVQIGKLLGARVIAAASTEEKRKFAASHGADATVDYTQANWRDVLKELTGGHGADVIFDPVGGDVSVQAFRSIAWNGRHLVVGFAAGSIPALPFNLPLLKGGVLMGVDVAQIARREPEAERRATAQLFTWLAEKKLVPVVGQVFSFADFRDAFRAMQNRSALGKMVVRIG